MRLSAEQAATLARPAAASFEQRACAFLLRGYPALAGDAGRLESLVQRGRLRGQLNGFTSERNLVLGLLVALHIGPGFDTDPRFAPAPDAAARTPEARLHAWLALAAAQPGPDGAVALGELVERVVAEFSNAPPGEPVKACAPEAPEAPSSE